MPDAVHTIDRIGRAITLAIAMAGTGFGAYVAALGVALMMSGDGGNGATLCAAGLALLAVGARGWPHPLPKVAP